MAQTVESLQAEFNTLLGRIKKGEIYLARTDIMEEKKSKALTRYEELLESIAEVTGKLTSALARELTPQELTDGF